MALVTDQNKQFILNEFQGVTFNPNELDIEDTPLYDTVTLAQGQVAGPNTVSWFTNVRANTGKTLADTNMVRDSELAAPEMFSIRAIGIWFHSTMSLRDIEGIMRYLALQIVVGKKPKIEGPVWQFCAGGGISGFTTATSTSVYQNGIPSRESLCRLASPIVIPSNVNFSASLQGTNYTLQDTNGLRTTLIFRGLYAKGVQ